MMPDASVLGESLQHVVVSGVALVALAVVLRRVAGVFGSGASASTPAGGPPASTAPACGHCAAGHAASRTSARRDATGG